jgi:hypothetical protein
MTRFLLHGAACALPFIVTLPAMAAYNPGIVAADARWVVHGDFDALRASALGKEVANLVAKAQSEATGGIIGLDIQKVLATVGSVTAYGTNFSKEPNSLDGALIARGTPDLRKIVESAMLQGTIAEPQVFVEVSDLPFPAYAITDPKAAENARTQLVVAFPPEPVIIISKSKAQVLKARDVFRGSAPSLQKSAESPLSRLTAKSADAYFFAATVVPAENVFPQNAPQTRMLQLASSGSIAIGEEGPNTFAHAELVASSAANAEKLVKILQGLTAMFSLAESNDKQLAEFLNATAVSREKDTVTLHLAYSSTRLAQMAQSVRNQAEGRPARPPTITQGRTIAEWSAVAADPAAASDPAAVTWRTIENVKLVNGMLVTVGRYLNGGKVAKVERVEVVPAEGTGAPMIFKNEFMRNIRGTMSQFQFPGTDGNYTLKVAYLNDPDGKAKYAVSLSEPRVQGAPPAPAAPPPSPR